MSSSSIICQTPLPKIDSYIKEIKESKKET